MRNLFITWIAMFVIGYVYFEYVDKKQNAVRRDLGDTQSTVDQLSRQVQEGNPEITSELSTLKSELQRITQQVEAYKKVLGNYEDTASLKASERAVSRVQATRLATQLSAIRVRLTRLKELDAQWQVQLASLMNGEPGRKVASSPAQLELLLDVLERERPTTEQITMWDTQVTELAAPIELALGEEQAAVALVPEHETALADLARAVSEATAD